MLLPSNCASPIAATVSFRSRSGAAISAEFDFRHSGDQVRALALETDAGDLTLAWQGCEIGNSGMLVELGTQQEEYVALYEHFAALVAQGRSEIDQRPLELVLDILRLAERTTVAPFQE